MKDPILEEIKDFAIRKLKARASYVGVAESDNFVMLNSEDRNGNDITIKIESKPE